MIPPAVQYTKQRQWSKRTFDTRSPENFLDFGKVDWAIIFPKLSSQCHYSDALSESLDNMLFYI